MPPTLYASPHLIVVATPWSRSYSLHFSVQETNSNNHCILTQYQRASWLNSMGFSLSIKRKFLDINIKLILYFPYIKLIFFLNMIFFFLCLSLQSSQGYAKNLIMSWDVRCCLMLSFQQDHKLNTIIIDEKVRLREVEYHVQCNKVGDGRGGICLNS